MQLVIHRMISKCVNDIIVHYQPIYDVGNQKVPFSDIMHEMSQSCVLKANGPEGIRKFETSG